MGAVRAVWLVVLDGPSYNRAVMVTLAMVTDALALSGIELPEDDREALVEGANTVIWRACTVTTSCSVTS